MNEILQKRIEEAARRFSVGKTYSKTPNELLWELPYDNKAEYCFKKGIDYILNNLWISVEEALPDKGHEVLVAILNTKTNTHFFGFDAIVDDSLFLRDKNGFTIDVDYHKITHWAPIPSLEGGEK